MKEIALPPQWCQGICKNSLSDACVEDCAIDRKCRNFKLKESTLEDLPDYPINDFSGMTKEEKGTSLAVYVSKITEFLKGGEDELRSEIRQSNDYPRSCRIFKDVKK